jgi:hypothetical protein
MVYRIKKQIERTKYKKYQRRFYTGYVHAPQNEIENCHDAIDNGSIKYYLFDGYEPKQFIIIMQQKKSG